MLKRDQIYKCEKCGNMVEGIHGSAGQLVCCGQPMNLQEENTQDAAQEKHVPVVEKTPDGIMVKVGSIGHPMEDKHYIEWIEVIDGDTIYRHHLKAGEEPQATFPVKSSNILVRAYCNLHGLWKA